MGVPTSWKIAFISGVLLLPRNGARAAQTPADRHQRVIQFLKKTASDISARSLTQIRSMADWTKERPVIKRQLLSMLGLDPLPKRTPLKVRITGTLQRKRYRIEKIVFQSMPGLYMTANLDIPTTKEVS